MSTIVDRLRKKIIVEEKPEVTQVFKFKEEDVENQTAATVESVPTPVQTLVETKVIKQNNPGVPVMGFTMEVLSDELGLALATAMHKAGVSSVSTDVFGLFNQLGLTPKGFDRVVDEYTGDEFFVLQNAERMTEIFKSLVKALNTSSLDVISFPYLVETTLDLKLRYQNESQDFEMGTIVTKGLYLTPRELDGLNYKFITEIQFCAKQESEPESIDLLVMKIDREEWKAAPYRI